MIVLSLFFVVSADGLAGHVNNVVEVVVCQLLLPLLPTGG